MHRLFAALLLLGLAATSSAQSLPPPGRSTSAWDTQVLVNEAHNLTPEALPDLRRRAEAGGPPPQAMARRAAVAGDARARPRNGCRGTEPAAGRGVGVVPQGRRTACGVGRGVGRR